MDMGNVAGIITGMEIWQYMNLVVFGMVIVTWGVRLWRER